MQLIRISIVIFFTISSAKQSTAQTVNWKNLNQTTHIVTAGMGWDYSLSYMLGYAYHPSTDFPLIISSSISLPYGEDIFDDFKIKLGSQFVLYKRSHFVAAISLNGIYRTYQSPLVKMQNIGAEVKGVAGYYQSKWFIAVELAFDKAISTHLRHSDLFREHVFYHVTDSWYPATGGNFGYGVQSGYSRQNFDITFNIGMVTNENLQNTPMVPYYLMLGFNYKINSRNP